MIERSIRNRSDRLLTQFRSLLTGAETLETQSAIESFSIQIKNAEAAYAARFSSSADARIGFLQFSCWPAAYDPERFTLQQIRDALPRRSNVGGWTDPLWAGQDGETTIQDGIEAWVEHPTTPSLRFWRLNQSGLLFHRQTIHDDVTGRPYGFQVEPGEQIEAERLVANVGMAVSDLVNLYSRLYLTDEFVTMRFELLNTQDRKLKVPAGWTMADFGNVSRIPSITVTHPASIEEWIAAKLDIARRIVDEIFQRFNASNRNFPRSVLTNVVVE